MSTTVSVQFDEETSAKLDELSRQANRPQSFYIKRLVRENIDRLLYENSIRQDCEDIEAGRISTMSLEELRKISDVAD
ncbi:type II toxin-antitoxin system RelB family antitoxin [Mobiluncus mulieris]|uniref:type II toxin-antitoxin system RelB family antitoxin n=1 Tax=Mobiluncus mulieris TaxID=2052 RepID=UPI00147065BD|nr:hypothetical protein [Mobiluncus mulieris]NMX11360.1 hypothetical protein [Mobiluncus mulieris]